MKRTYIASSLIAAVYVAGTILLVIGALRLQANRDPKFAPLKYANPMKVLTPVVSLQNPTVTVRLSRCNSWDKPLAVEGSIRTTNVDTGVVVAQLLSVYLPTGGSSQPSPPVPVQVSVLNPGCLDTDVKLALANLTAGRWRVQGRTVATSDRNEVQLAQWESEPFEVVP